MSSQRISRSLFALVCAVPFAACEDLGIEDADALGLIDDLGIEDADALGLIDVMGDATDAAPVSYAPMTARFSPEDESFYAMPWPSDARTTDAGLLDLSDFPDPSAGLFRDYLNAVQDTVEGYSLMPVLYVGLSDNPMPQTPPPPANSLTPRGAVQLIDLSDARCGERTPVEVFVSLEADPFIDENVLMAAPLSGHVLHPATPYAYVVTPQMGNEDGFRIAVNSDASDALRGDHGDATLNALYAPLRNCLDQLEDGELTIDDISIATVFTTQDPLTEMRSLRDYVMEGADVTAPKVLTFENSDVHSRAAYGVYFGTYETPIFQDGDSPYRTSGGQIHFDAAGDPILQRWEEVPFTVVTPSTDEPPHDLLIWVDGTGANETSWIKSSVTESFLDAGFAVASYTAQFHGERATPGADPELHSFNLTNPQSFRNTFRQQVADTVYFLRVMTEARGDMPGLPAIDDSHVVYAGQSQGSLVGTMVAAVEPRIEAYVLNGVAAYLALTAVERKDPIDFAQLIAQLARIPADFDRFHPLMSLSQTGADASDPHAFAQYWAGWEGNPDGVDMLLINGVDDYTASVRGMNAIALAGNVAPVGDLGWDIDPFDVGDENPEALPLKGNRQTPDGTARTHAVIMSGSTGHFTIYDRRKVRESAVGFLRSAVDGAAELADFE